MGYAGLELDGQVAVVIGGTSGIGQVIACGLAEAGADVIPTSRRAEQVENTARRIEALGRRSLRVTSDVTDRASLQGLLNSSVEAFGKVDIMVNAAGRTKRTPILETEEREWNEILETNLTGALRAGQIFGRHMVDRRYGRIIHIASLGSFLALYEVAAYSASKAALASLTRTMAVEWAGSGVCVNAIMPGSTAIVEGVTPVSVRLSPCVSWIVRPDEVRVAWERTAARSSACVMPGVR